MRTLLGLLLLALAIGLPVGLLLADPGTRPAPKRERLEWGLYQIHWGRRFEGILAAELKKYAGKPDYDKRREGEPNWRIDVTPESLKAFNGTFARPR